MENAEDPYAYFENLPDLEQRSIIAAVDQGQELHLKNPDGVEAFESFRPEQADDTDYDKRKHEIIMGAKEFLSCMKMVSAADCKEAAKIGQSVEAHARQKYNNNDDLLVDGVGDAYRHCLWNAYM